MSARALASWGLVGRDPATFSWALVLAGVTTLAAGARADTPPSRWDVARDPSEADRWALHVRVERLLHPPLSENALPVNLQRDEELRLSAARALLEEADAPHSADVRLRFDLGRVYEQLATLEHREDLQQKVVDLLAPALEPSLDQPGASDALEALVYAYAKLDRPRDELSAWRRYIPRVLDDRARTAPLMNMGEAQMRLGQVDDALATFREGLRLCESLPNSSAVNSTYALTLWDTAIALDRSGDPGAALDAATKARAWTWAEVVGWGPAQTLRSITGWDIIRDQTDVFFVPEWEREWYLALGEAAAARATADVRDGARLWARAEGHWDTYVSRSSSSGRHDPWLSIARVRRDRAHATRVQTERRAAKMRGPVPAPGGAASVVE